MKKAVEFIKRKYPAETPIATITIRITRELKKELDAASDKLDTTLNGFSEAALNHYLLTLKEEKDL